MHVDMSVLNNGPGVVAAGGSPVLICRVVAVSCPHSFDCHIRLVGWPSESIAAEFKAQYSVGHS